jgi:ssDNA-binding replication factor A large subunit
MEYESILSHIEEKTNLKREEIERKIIEKQRELSGLVSKEGAAHIVAKELGLDLFKKAERRLQIKNVLPQIRNVNLTARILRVFDIIEFERDGRKGRVANVILGDESGTLRLSLWNDQTQFLENLKPGLAIEIFNAYSKEDTRGGVEIRLTNKGGIKILETSDIPPLEDIREPAAKRNQISNFKEGVSYEIRAALVQLFETNVFYEICPNCNKRLNNNECKEHGKVEPGYLVVLSGVIDDGSGNIRAVFFRDAALNLIGLDLKEALSKRDGFFEEIDVLGKEFVLNGKVRKNPMFGRLEFVINSVREIDSKYEANKYINSFGSNV